MKKYIVIASIISAALLASNANAQALYNGFSAHACLNYYMAFFPYTAGLEC